MKQISEGCSDSYSNCRGDRSKVDVAWVCCSIG